MRYLSTNIPACTAWTMLRNLGFSSGRRLATPIFLVKVHASQSRTSLGTDSACKSLSSSSVSNRRLQDRKTQLSVTVASLYFGHISMYLLVSRPVLLGLISVNVVQHDCSELQVPAEFQQVHDTPVHLLQDPLQPDEANTHTHTHRSHTVHSCAQLLDYTSEEGHQTQK